MRTRRGARPIRPTGVRPVRRSATCSPSGRPRAARPRRSTTRCGRGSRAPRTRSSPPATPPTPNATPSSRRTPTPRRRCWLEAEAIDASDPDAARAALRTHRRQVGRDRQGAPRACRRPRATPARGREEGARRGVDRLDRIPRRRPGPSSSGTAPSSTSSRPPRPRRRARPRTPSRPGPTPRSGGSGPRRQPRRSARSASGGSARAVAVAEVAVQQPLASAVRRRPGGAAPRRPVAPPCATTPPAPSGRSAGSPRSRRRSGRCPGPGCGSGDGLARPDRQHARSAHGHRRPGQRHPGQGPAPGQQAPASRSRRRTPASTRRTPATAARSPPRGASSPPTSTSQPLALPVCGSTNDTRMTNTRIATTKALAPGSISRATRRSAASMSVLEVSNVRIVPAGRRASHAASVAMAARVAGGRADRRHAEAHAGASRRRPASCASPARVRRWSGHRRRRSGGAARRRSPSW